MATARELDDLMKDMGVDESAKPERRKKRETRGRKSRSDKRDASKSSKRDKGKSRSKARSSRRSRRRELGSDEDAYNDEEEHAPRRRERRKNVHSKSSSSKRSHGSRKAASFSSDDDNDFDKPDPLPEDPARVSRTELTKIRDCISKLLRNQDDEEAYTFRGLRHKISEELQQPFASKPWRRWFRATIEEINQAIEDENSDWDDEDSDDMPVGAAWRSGRESSPSHSSGARYAHGETRGSDRTRHGRFADSDASNEKKLQNILGGAGAGSGESFAERLKRETQSLSKSKVGGSNSLISKLRATRTPGQKAGHAAVFGLHIGGVQVRRACRELRCLKCDFDVVCCPGYRWDESAKYIFFRNYVPNMKKLQPKLVRDRFMCAYACQCTWQSVREAKSLKGSRVRASPEGGAGSGGDVQWVARK